MSKPMTLAELRGCCGNSEVERRILAAIDGAAEMCGDHLAQIAATLFGAYIVIASAMGQGEAMMRIAIVNAEASIRDFREAEARRAAAVSNTTGGN